MVKPFVFVIEDDPKLSEIISITLQTDFDVEACGDGSTAMQRLKNVAPQIVVLDLNLPGASGREVLSYIRSEPRLTQTRVILTTADDRQAETLTNEADITLLKPVSPTQLRELALRMSSIK